MTKHFRFIFVVLLAIAVLGTAISLVRTSSGTTAANAPAYDELPRPRSLLVVGDSFAGGVGEDFPLYWQILADNAGWVARADAVGGSGYANSSLGQPPAIERLSADRERYTPDIVLVDLGRNDLGTDPALVAPRVAEYLTELRQTFPEAAIVVMVPSYVSADEPVTRPAMRENIERIATRIDAVVVDPGLQGWFRDRDLQPLLWDDGIHLNARGSVYYAERLYADLVRLGIVQAGAS